MICGSFYFQNVKRNTDAELASASVFLVLRGRQIFHDGMEKKAGIIELIAAGG